MREKTCNQKSKNKLFVLRGFGLILAFVVVFALVLGFGVYDGSITTDSTNQVALASTSDPSGTNDTTVCTFTLDNLEDITADSLGYPGTSSKTSFTTGNVGTTTTSFSNQSNISYSYKGGLGTPDAPTPSFSADNGTYKLSFDTAQNNRYEYGWSVVNFDINSNPIFYKLLSSSVISNVKAVVAGTVSYDSHNENSGYVVDCSVSGKTASDYNCGDNASGTTKSSGSFSKELTIKSSSTDTPKAFISLLIYCRTGHKGLFDNYDMYPGYSQITGLTINLTFTRNNSYPDIATTSINDGAAPQVTSFDTTTTNIQTTPYRPDNTQDGHNRWNVWYDSSTTTGAKVASYLSKAKDVVSVGSKVKLNSYSNGTQFTFTWSNITAYKRLAFQVTDYFDYDETGDATIATYPLQAAGIKSVEVGYVASPTANSAFFDLAVNASAFKNTATLTSGGTNTNIKRIYWQKDDESVEECGYAYIKRDSTFPTSNAVFTGRNTATVIIYFTKNCDITVTIADYGDKSVKQKIEVRGIDTTLAVAPTLSQDDNMISTSNNYANIDWIYSNTYDFDGEDNSDALEDSLWYAPHIYYYEMQKLGNATTETDPSKAFSSHTNLTKAQLLQRLPYAVGDFTGFNYDFTRGCTSNGIYPSGGITSNGTTDNYCKGNGYYRLYIYTLDLAGNLSSTTRVYYFKVDYEEATYDLSMSYTFNNSNVVITAENNGQWATSSMVATLTQNKVSLSGNVIVFEDAMGESHTIDIGSYATYHKNSSTPDGPCLARIDGTVINNIPTLSIGGVTYYEVVENQIYFAATQIAYGQSTFIYKIYFLPDIEGLISYATLDYMTIIEIANGVNYDAASVVYYNDDWNDKHGNDGVIIRVDRTKPVAPSISDENGNFVGIDISSVLPADLDDLGINSSAERHWYTNGYTIDMNVNFPEALANTYTDDIRVYIGIVDIEQVGNSYSGFKTLSQFTNIDQQTRNIITSYNSALNGIFGSGYWRSIPAGNFTDGILDISSYNLITTFGIGLRVIYTWAIDQSGNMGDVQVYYILVDPTTYYVTAQVNSGNISRFGEDDASITVTDVAENSVNSFKRGDVLVVKTSISTDYVIYTLKKKVADSERVLGENTASVDMLEVLDTSYVTYDGGTFTITADIESVFDYYNTETTLNDGNPRVYFELTYRKVIYPSITASYARYAGLAGGLPLLSVPYAMGDMSEGAQSALTFTFYVDEDYSILTNSTNAGLINGADGSTPVNVGVYYVAINSDSEYYIVNQTVKSQFTIVAANLHIDVKDDIQVQYLLTSAIIWEDCVNITGLLGDAIDEYTNNGFNIFNSGRLGLKDVNGVVQDLTESIPVGTYSVYQEVEFVLNNYNITFSSNKLDVIPHKLMATAFSYTKSFGDPDEIRHFDILITEFTGISIEWQDVFSTSRITAEHVGNYYRFTPILRQWIKRETGEDVGVYEIYLTTDEFVIESSNFTIVLSTPTNETPTLTITQRQITVIPVSGQKYEDDAGHAHDVEGIRYSYNSDEARFFTSEYITGELGLATTPTGEPDTSVTGRVTYHYEIVIGTLASKTTNIALIFTPGILFDITEITEGEIVRVSQLTWFEIPYGVGLSSTSLDWNDHDYQTDIPASLTQQYEIHWNIGSIPATRDVGTYPITVDNAIIYDLATGNPIPNYTVAVNTIYVTITPLPITITPVIDRTTKIYGDLDKTSWTITYTAIRNGDDMNDKIQPGEFIRAIFRKSDDTMLALESRFDGISDANGELTYEGEPAYYGLAIRRDFETTNPNYSIVYSDFSDVRFTITVRKIVVNPETSFFGINKNYDGSVVASYGAGDTSIVFSDYLARQDEDIKIAFTAVYDSANAGINKKITFSNLSLTGSAAYNYVLYFGTDLENVPYVDQTVEISKLIPTATGDSNIIQIYSVTVAIGKADFTISKQYDGTTTMTSADVTIDDTSVLKSFNFTVNASSYPSIEVSNAYSTNVTIVFTYEAGASMDNMNIVDNQDEDITIVQDDVAGKITIVLRNMPVAITKKIVTIDDIENIAGVTRYYDSSTAVQVVPTINASTLAYGDNSEDTYIKFAARAATITTENPGVYDKTVVYNGTTYYVVFEKNANTNPYNVFLENVAITSAISNYEIDISEEDLEKYSIANRNVSSVVINKAQLNLSTIVGVAEYTGLANVASELIGTAKQVTSAISSDLIVTSAYDSAYIVDIYNELANITFNMDTIKAYYTKDGALYPYVILADDGNVARHEISIANLILSKSATSGMSEDELNAILANYTLAGTAYTINTDGSVEEAEAFDLAIGQVIAEDVYENGGKGLSSIITAWLSKKEVQINAANITLPNKVYDGTTAGIATIDDLSAIGIVPTDVDKINVTLTATYATKDVGTKIRVDIANVTFTDKTQYDANHSSNYAIGTSTAYAYRAITKSYAVIDYDLASKVYDGTNSVAQSAIKPFISVPYSRDNGLYSVNTSFAFLGGKDVVHEDNLNVLHDESDSAKIYGIKLVSSRTTVNYDLYVKTVVNFALYDEFGAPTSDFEDYISANPLVSREATAFYYARRTDTSEMAVYSALSTQTLKTVRAKDYSGAAPEIGDVVAGYGTYIGTYVSNTIRYYAFESSETDAKEYEVMPIKAQYNHFVDAATLAFSIKPKSGASSFNKTFDGTTDLTQEYNVNFDIGLTLEEETAIKNALVGKYATSNVGSTSVVFTISDAVVLNNPNYSVTDIKVSVAGYITKAIINSYLEDTEVLYGTLINDRKYNIIYGTNAYAIDSDAPLVNRNAGDTVDIFVKNGVFGYYQKSLDTNAVEGKTYYTFTPSYKQVSITRFSQDRHYYYMVGDVYTEATIYEGGETYYICESIEYTAVDFTVLEQMYEFVPIVGTINAPSIKTSVTNSTNAKAEGYSMYLNGGSATNFNFKYGYTNGTNSKLIVTKVTLYAYVIDDYVDPEGSSENYASSVVYDAAGTMPQFTLGYAASPTTMLSGFVNGQTSAIFNQAANTAPITKVYLFDGTNYTECTDMASLTVSEELPAGSYYIIYIDLSDAVAINYTFALKAGSEMSDSVKLLLQYPDITDYAVTDTTVTYDGTQQNVKVTGNSGATVSYQYFTNSEMTTPVGTSVVNAGEYYAKVTITKAKYRTLVAYASLVIKKANFKISIPSKDVDYDGLDHYVDIRTSNVAPSVLSLNVTYQLNGETNSSAINVGSYFVTATYTTIENYAGYNGGQYNDNFNSATGTGSIVVQGAVVQVIVKEEDKMARLVGDEVSMNYSISIDEKYKDMLESAGYDYDNYVEELIDDQVIYVQYYNTEAEATTDYLTEVTETGLYNYIIVSEDSNLILKGSVSGTFTVGVEVIEYLNSAEKLRASITAEGSTILNANAKIVYEKVTYTSKVNSQATTEAYKTTVANNKLYTQIESNIPSLATNFHSANLAGVLKVQMKVSGADGSSYVVQPNGKVKVKVYSTVPIDDSINVYQVTADGKLEKVEYTSNNGFITYETDYVNTIVFVKVGTFVDFITTNWWLIAVAAAILVAILVVVIVPSVVVTKKKKKAKAAAALATAGAGSASAPVAESAAPAEAPAAEPAPVEEPPIETPPVEEAPPMEEIPPVEEPPMDMPPEDLPPVEEPPVEEPPAVEPEPAPVEEPVAPKPEEPKKAPPPGAVGTKAPPPGAVGQKPAAAPKKAPPPGAVGTKPAAAPKKAPPPGAIGKKD